MRFKEFLLFEDNKLNFLDGLREIKEHCQPFLKEKIFLYRGINGLPKQKVFLFDHPSERRPLDSDPGFNVMFNVGVQLHWDIEEIRTKSIFCSGSSERVREFGDVFIIFPKGHFKFIYSEHIRDSVNNTLYSAIVNELGSTQDKMLIKNAFQELSKLGIRQGISVFLNDDKKVEEVFKQSAVEVRRAVKEVFAENYSNDSISKAAKTKNEILMYESDGYYAISRNHVISFQNEFDPRGLSTEEFLLNKIDSL